MKKSEISKYFSEMAKKRHKKMTKKERSAHGLKMYLGTKRAKERAEYPMCVECGCTERSACKGGCEWVETPENGKFWVCSKCV